LINIWNTYGRFLHGINVFIVGSLMLI